MYKIRLYTEAEEELETGKVDLISFGSSFISNPDLVTRFKNSLELATGNPETFYSPGVEGYNDYPFVKWFFPVKC